MREKWDERYRQAVTAVTAAAVLTDNAHLLPLNGTALDLACGLGGNALALARHGLETHAWDISPVAIERLQAEARREELSVHTEVRDVERAPPPPESFDVIVVSHFLERSLCPALTAALKPGGLLFYQTFSRERVSDEGPKNPDYRLAPGELLALFPWLRPLVYRDEGWVGDPTQGFRNQALLVAKKP
jgi:2-polyprenyl-3-methyl-5-hydroxy-6-metoxy-1,4-benzoquinol methylase